MCSVIVMGVKWRKRESFCGALNFPKWLVGYTFSMYLCGLIM